MKGTKEMSIAIIKNTNTGKIKRKLDARRFIDEQLGCGSEICFTEVTRTHQDYYGNTVVIGEQYHIYKDIQGRTTATVRNGNLRDIFNPEVRIADTKENNYAMSIYDVVWLLRKKINEKYFS